MGNLKIMKQTRIWTTREGEEVRICDMDDEHLKNAIKMLERVAEKRKCAILLSAYNFETTLNGEMAQLQMENEIRFLEEEEDFLPEVYESLVLERERREQIKESTPLPWR